MRSIVTITRHGPWAVNHEKCEGGRPLGACARAIQIAERQYGQKSRSLLQKYTPKQWDAIPSSDTTRTRTGLRLVLML